MALETARHNAVLIRGARIVDPAAGRDESADVAIVDGLIARAAPTSAYVIEADGMILCPGLVDMHVHLREPGHETKETIATGTAAAAAGGFTFVACMPNTTPVLDNPDTLKLVHDRSREADRCGVGPVAAITVKREGRELTDFATLLEAGAVAFSDDGTGVEDDEVMLAAFQRAKTHDALLIQHCEYKSISAGGVMHLGDVSRRIGLPGLDPRSEEAMIERDIALCRETGARYHVAHISTAKAIQMVREAKAEGLPVTAEVCTHHLVLTDEACGDADPNTKMHPPLRPMGDVDACRAGLLDGTIDCIVTDHAPHRAEEKAAGFLAAPPGIVGLETAVGLAARAMIETGLADWPAVIRWFTAGPNRVLGRTPPPIEPGSPADLTIIDTSKRWTVDRTTMSSKGRNTPFIGWELIGRPFCTVRRHQIALCR
ncbi:MAG: dihydroorotase [Planctomycetes bacterium]|nr:dihydroorotase [Planctomycetota bacterium]